MSIVGGQLAKHRGTKEARILSDKVDEYLRGIVEGKDVLRAYEALTRAPYTTKPEALRTSGFVVRNLQFGKRISKITIFDEQIIEKILILFSCRLKTYST